MSWFSSSSAVSSGLITVFTIRNTWRDWRGGKLKSATQFKKHVNRCYLFIIHLEPAFRQYRQLLGSGREQAETLRRCLKFSKKKNILWGIYKDISCLKGEIPIEKARENEKCTKRGRNCAARTKE
jgi:hypothetical protein